MTKEKTCAEKVRSEFEKEIKTMRNLWESDKRGEETCKEEETSFSEYGLSFDYVEPENGENGYFRYQISWGGPSDEFRFYCGPGFNCYQIEYWFMDWFDGAKVTLSGEDKTLMLEIFDFYKEIGSAESEYEKATEV